MKVSMILFIMLFSLNSAFADLSNQPTKDCEQKVVYLEKRSSYELEGESADQKNAQVLPKYLKEGWVVVSISAAGGNGAYVLLKREKTNWDEKSVKDSNPKTTPGVDLDTHTIVLSGYNDIKVNTDSVSMHQIINTLESYHAKKDSKIILKINKQAAHQTVVQLMDLLNKAGYTQIVFAE